jgi:cell shape-determining protein MreC
LIGQVSSVTLGSNGILQLVTVKTAVDIYRLEEVFIVLSSPESEKTS